MSNMAILPLLCLTLMLLPASGQREGPKSIQFSPLNAECEFTHQCASGQFCSETPLTDRKDNPTSVTATTTERPQRQFEPPAEQQAPREKKPKTCVLAPAGSPPHVALLACAQLSDCPAAYQCDVQEKTCFFDAEAPLHQQGVVCKSDADCFPTHSCEKSSPKAKNFTCINNPSKPIHITGRRCDYDFQCDATYECRDATCYFNLSKPIHVLNIDCHFPHHCPARHRCEARTCYADAKYPLHLWNVNCQEEGTNRKTNKPPKAEKNKDAESEKQVCPVGYFCAKSTCFAENEYAEYTNKTKNAAKP